MINYIKSKIFYSMPKSIIEKKDVLENSVTKDLVFRISKFGNENPDKIFYVIKRFPGAGLFSNLTFVLNHLKIAEDFGFCTNSRYAELSILVQRKDGIIWNSKLLGILF